MSAEPLTLCILPDLFAVCRLAAGDSIPAWAFEGPFSSITRTREELSLVCSESLLPQGIQNERGWRALQVLGPLDFSLTGILAGLAGTLAQAEISLFVLSTYDTDYILVRDANLADACQSLQAAGYRILT